MFDDLTEEQYLTREAFALYGRAMYYAQCLERSLGILLTLNQTKNRLITKFQLNYELEENFSKTFGTLISTLREKRISISLEIEKKLRQALIERNRLAHDYWWEKAVAITREDGVQIIISELEEITILFQELDVYFTNEYEKHHERLGIKNEIIESILKDYKTGELIEFPKERLLKKIEHITKILRFYSESNSQTFTPIFVLKDNSNWTLGDSGLIPAPDSIKIEKCVVDKCSGTLCPCEVTTNAIKSGNWDYILKLDNGYKIIVKKKDKIQNSVFSFSFKKESTNK